IECTVDHAVGAMSAMCYAIPRPLLSIYVFESAVHLAPCGLRGNAGNRRIVQCKESAGREQLLEKCATTSGDRYWQRFDGLTRTLHDGLTPANPYAPDRHMTASRPGLSGEESHNSVRPSVRLLVKYVDTTALKLRVLEVRSQP